ncbi:DUF4328 domain-containing protein [Streptomyces sp. NBC_01363]|uniref:DUF4328 domain-containing protein n=1 Tax=Streptomyces sp. NBC_01363 TaxID=2903840 RepID=UPI00225875F0|nr:DUF4328 domain-containing protein [Streptomyces sp. NBC_01363]MCX4729466.1 DUF4328 domain-containing protein [Streptomyces sp. NBC_01363]MCX4736888.1 DUF4328 domain-containing protein [Streptomyces sp. NBC_01363]
MDSPQQGMHVRLTGAATTATILILLSLVREILVSYVNWRGYFVIQDYLAGGATDADLEADDFVSKLVTWPTLLVLLAAGVAFLVWLWRARINAELMSGAAAHRRSRGWVIGAWTIPVASLFYPYQIVEDIWQASAPRRPAPVGLVAAWWALFVAATVIKPIQWRLASNLESEQDALSNAILSTVLTVLYLAAGVLVTLVIRRITEWQTLAAPALPPQPSGSAPTGINGKTVTGVAAAIAVLVVLTVWAVHTGSDSNGTSTISSTTPSPTYDADQATTGDNYGTGEGSSSEGGYGSDSPTLDEPAPDEPAPDESSAEDMAFSDLETDDCLSNYNDAGSDWIPATPETTNCSDTDAYFVVASVEQDEECTSDMTWFHSNDDATDTDLCLNRNFAVGQCMFAEVDGEQLSMYFNAVTPCDAAIPDDYQYTVRLTRVYSGGAPDDACGDDRMWTTDGGAALCGEVPFKRSGLPDV